MKNTQLYSYDVKRFILVADSAYRHISFEKSRTVCMRRKMGTLIL